MHIFPSFPIYSNNAFLFQNHIQSFLMCCCGLKFLRPSFRYALNSRKMRRDRHDYEEIIVVRLKIFKNKCTIQVYLICKSDKKCIKFVFASQRNSIVESCFRNRVNGDCKLLPNIFPPLVFKGAQKIHRGSFKLQSERLHSSHQNGLLFKLKNTLLDALKREKKRRRLSYSKHQSRSVFNVCDFRQRLWPLSGLDRRGHMSKVCHYIDSKWVLL